MMCRSGIVLLLLMTIPPVSLGLASKDVWVEVNSPNFTVITNGSARNAGRTARTFEQFRLLIKTSIPTISVDPGMPLTIITARNEKSYLSLLGEDRQKSYLKRTTGIFTGSNERKVVVIRDDISEVQRYRTSYHEYVHMLMRSNLGRLPLWLDEGLAEFFSFAVLSDRNAILGYASPEAIRLLRDRPLLPLTTLFAVTHDSPHYREKDKSAIFYAQSWALTHYLLVGEKRAHEKKLYLFIGLIRKGLGVMEAASQAFGDLNKLETALGNYVHSASFYSYHFPVQLRIEKDQYRERTLSRAESLAMRGELLVFMNKNDLAREALDLALQDDPRSVRANEAMGYLHLSLQDSVRAKKYFTAAVENGSTNSLAYFYAARTIIMQPEPVDVAAAENHLRKAIELNPNFAYAYGALATLLHRQKKYDESLKIAGRAMSLAPGELGFMLNAANTLATMGDFDRAYAMGLQTKALAQTEAERRNVELFLNIFRTVKESRAAAEQARDAERRRIGEAAKAAEEEYRRYLEDEGK
ncbi:MAG TPA: tetratricopeptide repeat protein, partial [Acidobacteriota bacterium]|nr:tetratricopeptide repeat protein [Acidobacteriota bacterium]